MAYINEALNEFNKNLEGKKVAIIGLGVSNIPMLSYLAKYGAETTVFDKREFDSIDIEAINEIKKYNIKTSLGEKYLDGLKGFDYIFRSPSCRPDVPAILEEIENGAILTSEIEMVMKLCPGTIIGITGSDGKTTTTSLIYEIVKTKGLNVFLGGNIGKPLFTKIDEMTPDSIVILELSSFQLMNMETSPHIAVITNVTPNHLDIHKSYEEYIDSKKSIFKNQTSQDILVLNYDNEITRNIASEAKGKVVFFSSNTKLDNGYIVEDNIVKHSKDGIRRHILTKKNIKIRGKHNYENIAAALAATESLVDIDLQIKAIKEFSGVEHRLEYIREVDGTAWYNDSIGSSPTRTIAGLKAFDENIILIAGGYDKHLDYEPMAKPVVENVKSLILIGATAEKIQNAVKRELAHNDKEIEIYRCKTLEETVKIAKEISTPEDIVLFSPASASFDMFKNFEDRGNKFKELVNKL